MKPEMQIQTSGHNIKFYFWSDFPYASIITDNVNQALSEKNVSVVVEDIFKASLECGLFRLFFIIPDCDESAVHFMLKNLSECAYVKENCDISLEPTIDKRIYLAGGMQYAGVEIFLNATADISSVAVIALCLNRKAQAVRLGLIVNPAPLKD